MNRNTIEIYALKKFLPSRKLFFMRFQVALILSICSIGLKAQDMPLEFKIDSIKQSEKIEVLRQNFSEKKEFDTSFELTILTALSYFPELVSTNIKIKKANINTTMNARPSLFSLIFKKKENRQYIIRVTKKVRQGSVTLDGSSFNARVGVFAHELCHIVDYQKRDFIGVLKRLFDYRNKRSIEKYEKEIDRLTIEHGLGWQLFAWSNFVLNKSNGSEAYKAFKAQIYLEPHEIKQEIERRN